MTLKPCPKCGREVSPAAATCPQCGHPIAARAGFLGKPGLSRVANVGCAGLLVLGLFALCSDSDERRPRRRTDNDIARSAQNVCYSAVEGRLRAPRTAKFVSGVRSARVVGDTTRTLWQVTGEVDAQNAFGAMVRNAYTCQLRQLGQDRFQIVDVSILPR